MGSISSSLFYCPGGTYSLVKTQVWQSKPGDRRSRSTWGALCCTGEGAEVPWAAQGKGWYEGVFPVNWSTVLGALP